MASMTRSAKRSPLFFPAVLGAMLLTSLRLSPTNSYVTLALTKAALLPTSLASDPFIRTMQASPNTAFSQKLALLFAWLCSRLSLPPQLPLGAVEIILWAAQAALMFRFVRKATGSDFAAALAALAFGLDMPFFPSESTTQISYFERSQCMVPLLYGLCSLLEGRRWRAWAGVSLSVYLHANPSIYCLPLLALEEGLTAWRTPKERGPAALRLLGGAAMVAPLFLRVVSAPFPPGEEAYYRLGLLHYPNSTGGFQFAASDWVHMAEGAVLLALAALRGQKLRERGVLLRSIAVGLGLLALGTATHWAYEHGWRPAALFVNMHLWKALFLLELPGLVFLCAWLAEEIESRRCPELWPAFLFAVSLSAHHDFIVRLAALGLAACLLGRARKIGIDITLALAALPLAYLAYPDVMRAFALRAGLRGGLFALPAFRAVMAPLWLAILGLAHAVKKRPKLTWALAGTAFLAADLTHPSVFEVPNPDAARLADWVRETLPPEAAILQSPITLAACEHFLPQSERSLFPCRGYYDGAVFGAASAPMAERLRALGFDFTRMRTLGDVEEECRRADAALDVAKVGELARRYGASHFLTVEGRPWPWKRERTEGGLVLYRLGDEHGVRE